MTNATEQQIAAAFTKWERRYRLDPDKFMSEATKLLENTPHDYGEAAAPYFLEILSEIQAK
jgi:hypothetical protein